MIALDLLGVGDELLVNSEKSGLVKDGEERSPFLEVDVDTSIREQTRRNSQRLIGSLSCQSATALNVEVGLGIEISAGLASLLDFPLEGFCGIPLVKAEVTDYGTNALTDESPTT